jgi:parallel beta-helix repeat protein
VVRRTLIGVWLGLLLVTRIASADHTSGTIYVDASRSADGERHYATLPAALAGAAAQGAYTTVLIAPGTYDVQTLSLSLPGLTLKSSAGPQKTQLRGALQLLAKNITLQGLMIDATGQGVGITVWGARARIRDSVVTGAKEVGVLIQGGDESEIDSSEVRANRTGILVRSGSSARISRSRITGHESAGVVVLRPAFGVVLFQSSISLNQGAGISVEGARASVISQNEIRGNGLGVRLVGAQDTLLTDNTIAANRGPGLFLMRSRGSELAKNQIQDNETAGVVLQESTSNLLIHNQISGHRTGSGLELNSDSEANQIERNTIEGNGRGIWFNPRPIEETEHRPRANRVEANAIRANEIGVFIEASGGANRLFANAIEQNQRHGVQLVDVAGERVLQNQITQNGQIGLLLERAEHSVIRGNELHSNGALGLRAHASRDLLVEQNLLRGNPIGIELEGVKGAALRDNSLRGNQRDGLLLSASEDVTLMLNEITNNGGLGVRVLDTQVLDVWRNRVTGNPGGGLLVGGRSTQIELEENEISANRSYGLRVEPGVEVRTARRNYWGSALGPLGMAPDAPANSDRAEGLDLEKFFPWLPAAREELVEHSTQGLHWVNGQGGVMFEAERAGLGVRLSPEAAGASGTLVIARRVGPPSHGPTLEGGLRYWSVQLSGAVAGGRAQLEAEYEELPPTQSPSLGLYWLGPDAWRPLDGRTRPEPQRVVGTIAVELLRDATLALAPLGDVSSSDVAGKSPTSPSFSTVANASSPPPLPPQPNVSAVPSPEPQEGRREEEEKKAEAKSCGQTPRSGLMERLVEVVQALLRLDFARAWQGITALFQKEPLCQQ